MGLRDITCQQLDACRFRPLPTRPFGPDVVVRATRSRVDFDSRLVRAVSTGGCGARNRRRAITEGLLARGHSARDACRITGLARSSMQYHRCHLLPDREVRRLIDANAIVAIHQRSRGTYGPHRARAAQLADYALVLLNSGDETDQNIAPTTVLGIERTRRDSNETPTLPTPVHGTRARPLVCEGTMNGFTNQRP